MHRFLLITSLIFCSISFGQLHSVGFQFGGTGSNVGRTFAGGESKPKLDITGGLNYQYRFTSHLTLGGNLEFVQYGAQVPVDYENLSGDIVSGEYASWDWNYISIPLIVGFEMGGVVSFKPKAALVPSFLTQSFYHFKTYENTSLAPYKDTYYSQANKLDLAGMIGIDFSARFHSGTMFLGIDFRHSLTKLNNDDFFNTELFDPMRNKSVSATLGVRFKIGKPAPEGIRDIIDDPLK